MRETMRYSACMQVAKSQRPPRRTCFSAIFRLVGYLGRIMAAFFCVQPSCCPSRAARMSSTRRCANRRSISALCAMIAPSPAGSAKAASTASTETVPLSASMNSGKRAEGMRCVATPAASASAALKRSPVSPQYVPSSPGMRGRNQVAPTSGKKPMPTSGIAKEKRSPAQRCGDAPTHHDAIDQRDVRLAVALDRGVERIFIAPELQHLIVLPRSAEIVEMPYVAAGGEGARPCAGNDHACHRMVVRPRIKLRAQREHHCVRHCVERLRPVECNDARSAPALAEDFLVVV